MGIKVFLVVTTDVAISVTFLALETRKETLVGQRTSPLGFNLLLDDCLVIPAFIHFHQLANDGGRR
jgi:hypothetical protein